jgi:hypothetical protein
MLPTLEQWRLFSQVLETASLAATVISAIAISLTIAI